MAEIKVCNLVRKSPQNVEKIARLPGGEKSAESCHFSGCHGFFRSPILSALGGNEVDMLGSAEGLWFVRISKSPWIPTYEPESNTMDCLVKSLLGNNEVRLC